MDSVYVEQVLSSQYKARCLGIVGSIAAFQICILLCFELKLDSKNIERSLYAQTWGGFFDNRRHTQHKQTQYNKGSNLFPSYIHLQLRIITCIFSTSIGWIVCHGWTFFILTSFYFIDNIRELLLVETNFVLILLELLFLLFDRDFDKLVCTPTFISMK